jgi:hypothetical protein
VVLIGGGAWLLVTALFTLFTQLDGTFAWFFATLATVLVSSPSNAAQASVAQPGLLFVLLHLVIVLIQNGLGFGFAIGAGSLAGRRGVTARAAEWMSRRVVGLRHLAEWCTIHAGRQRPEQTDADQPGDTMK